MVFDKLLRYNRNIKYIYLDCETYNLCLNMCFNAPWEVEILEAIGTKTVNSSNYIINWLKERPELTIEPEVAIINHYNKDKVLKGWEPKEAFKDFWPKLKSCDFCIIHNALNFDYHLLKEYALYMNEDWKFLLNKVIDTNAIAKGIKLGIKFDKNKENFLEYQFRMLSIVKRGLKTNLKVLAKEYEINIENEKLLHSANFDCQVLKLLWEKMVYQIDI